MNVSEIVTENDNLTFCAIRVLGFIGMGLVGVGIIVGLAPAEIGLGAAAVITAVGGSLRLKGDANQSVDNGA